MNFPLVVIPAGGKAERMGDLCKTTPKWALEIKGRKVIDHILAYWMNHCVRAVVVVRPGQKQFDSLFDGKGRIDFIERDTPTVNEAILEGLRFAHCPERFVVVLGDCLVDGEFDCSNLGKYCGVGVMEGDTDFARSYAVGVHRGDVDWVLEKPSQGMGIYFLNWEALPSLMVRGGITQALQLMRTNFVTIKGVPFIGRYLNLTYPEDLERW